MCQTIRFSLALLALAGCSSSTEPQSPPPLLTKLPRALSPAEQRIVDGANTFSFALLREATKNLRPDSNAFLSPLSGSMALGMALNGAAGETFTGMQTALRLTGMTEANF